MAPGDYRRKLTAIFRSEIMGRNGPTDHEEEPRDSRDTPVAVDASIGDEVI